MEPKKNEEKTEVTNKLKKYNIIRDFRQPYEGKIVGGKAKLIKRSQKTIGLDPGSKFTQSLLSNKDSKGRDQKPYIREA